jgi:hypothetical protein
MTEVIGVRERVDMSVVSEIVLGRQGFSFIVGVAGTWRAEFGDAETTSRIS